MSSKSRLLPVGLEAMATAANRVLYWGSGSPPCWRVMIMLNEKRLPYTSKKLEFSKSKLAKSPV